jgi:hypothetical protein
VDLGVSPSEVTTELADLVAKTDRHLLRKIRTLVLSGQEYAGFADRLTAQPHLVLWAAKADGADPGQGDSPVKPAAHEILATPRHDTVKSH